MENIEIPLYRTVINLLIHDNCEKAVKMLSIIKKSYIREYDWGNMLGAYVAPPNQNIHAIVLAEDAGIDTISHECFHATMGVLQAKGIAYCEESEECFAYVLGYLTQKVWDFKQEYDKNK